MKATLAVLIAATLCGAAPAHACATFLCLGEAVGDDVAPPFTPPLSPAVEAQVRYRDGRGLSQAGFYNDPSVYMGEAGPRVIQSPYGGVLRRRY
jgi:hypothetical protein